MKEKLTDLEEIIKAKAKNRLDRDLDKFVRDTHGFADASVSIPILKTYLEHDTNGEAVDLCWLIRHIVSQLKDRRLEKYVYDETRTFVEKVEDLSRDVEDLKNVQYEEYEKF